MEYVLSSFSDGVILDCGNKNDFLYRKSSFLERIIN